jgi:hypothetical protein
MNLLFFIIISKTFRRLNVFTDDDDILKGLSTTVSESDCTSELTSTTSFIGIAVPLNMRYTLDRLDKGFSLLFVPYQINNRYIGSPLIVIGECLSCEANSI